MSFTPPLAVQLISVPSDNNDQEWGASNSPNQIRKIIPDNEFGATIQQFGDLPKPNVAINSRTDDGFKFVTDGELRDLIIGKGTSSAEYLERQDQQAMQTELAAMKKMTTDFAEKIEQLFASIHALQCDITSLTLRTTTAINTTSRHSSGDAGSAKINIYL